MCGSWAGAMVHCRREQKQDEKEWEELFENMSKIDRAQARKEAREAAMEGDVSVLLK